MYAGKRLTIDHEGVADRAYRLHFNASQQRVDSFTAVRAPPGGFSKPPFPAPARGVRSRLDPRPPPRHANPQVGSSVGLAAAAYILHQGQSGKHPPAIGLVGGAAVGAALGVLAHVLTRPADQATPNRRAAL
jgi:hypothetical protein